jgi:hypothetical protein
VTPNERIPHGDGSAVRECLPVARSDFVTHSPEALSPDLQEVALEEKHEEGG